MTTVTGTEVEQVALACLSGLGWTISRMPNNAGDSVVLVSELE